MNALLATAAIITALGAASPLMAETITKQPIDVSTSNVVEDLTCFYHNAHPKNTLTYLVPSKQKGDLYDDFKFITMYAHAGDLYLYFYSSYYVTTFDGVSFEYSTSTTANESLTAIAEEWHTGSQAFQATVHDTSGEQRKFYKCVAKSFYTATLGSEHRVTLGNLNLKLNGQSLFTRSCDSPVYSWKDANDNEDQVYSYYKDNYVVIDDALATLQLIPYEYDGALNQEIKSSKELFWLFFSFSNSSKGDDYQFGKLKGVSLTYDYLTYTNTYRTDADGWGVTTVMHRDVYGGLYQNPDTFFYQQGRSSRDATFELNASERLYSKVAPSTRKIYNRNTWLFDWDVFVKDVSYSYSTIQDLDDTSVSKISDDKFKGFIEDNRGSYMYAIQYKDDMRYRTGYQPDYSDVRDFNHGTDKIWSKCHDAKSLQILTLTFQNGQGVAEFNALMDPVDTSTVSTTPAYHWVNAYADSDFNKKLKAILITIAVVGASFGIAYLVLFLIKYAKSPSHTSGGKSRK